MHKQWSGLLFSSILFFICLRFRTFFLSPALCEPALCPVSILPGTHTRYRNTITNPSAYTQNARFHRINTNFSSNQRHNRASQHLRRSAVSEQRRFFPAFIIFTKMLIAFALMSPIPIPRKILDASTTGYSCTNTGTMPLTDKEADRPQSLDGLSYNATAMHSARSRRDRKRRCRSISPPVRLYIH